MLLESYDDLTVNGKIDNKKLEKEIKRSVNNTDTSTRRDRRGRSINKKITCFHKNRLATTGRKILAIKMPPDHKVTDPQTGKKALPLIALIKIINIQIKNVEVNIEIKIRRTNTAALNAKNLSESELVNKNIKLISNTNPNVFAFAKPSKANEVGQAYYVIKKWDDEVTNK